MRAARSHKKTTPAPAALPCYARGLRPATGLMDGEAQSAAAKVVLSRVQRLRMVSDPRDRSFDGGNNAPRREQAGRAHAGKRHSGDRLNALSTKQLALRQPHGFAARSSIRRTPGRIRRDSGCVVCSSPARLPGRQERVRGSRSSWAGLHSCKTLSGCGLRKGFSKLSPCVIPSVNFRRIHHGPVLVGHGARRITRMFSTKGKVTPRFARPEPPPIFGEGGSGRVPGSYASV